MKDRWYHNMFWCNVDMLIYNPDFNTFIRYQQVVVITYQMVTYILALLSQNQLWILLYPILFHTFLFQQQYQLVSLLYPPDNQGISTYSPENLRYLFLQILNSITTSIHSHERYHLEDSMLHP